MELQLIQSKIYTIRGYKVMIDFDLAEMYGIETRVLKQAVRRNIDRFNGDDFMFELTPDEVLEFSRSQFVTLNRGRGSNMKYAPFAFTELGVAMLSSVLNSKTAIEINRGIMNQRCFNFDFIDKKAYLENLAMKEIHPSLHLIFPAVISSLIPNNCQAKNVKPNIIYILADDLGYAELGCYGQKKIETPNIDQLAREGLRFTQFYAGAPVSAPSRSTLLTGLHTGHTPIRGNDEMASRGDVWNLAAMIDNPNLEGQAPMPAGTVTIATVLKNAGYATACIGKWGLGYPGSVSTPEKVGFDFFYGYNCQRQAHDYFPPYLYRNEKREFLLNKVIHDKIQVLDKNSDIFADSTYAKYRQQDYSPDLMFKELIQYVQKNKHHPFFMYWATPIPHVPLQAPQQWIDYYIKKFGSETPYIGNKGYFPCRYPHATYAAMISYLDEQVGILIKELKTAGIYNNTLIIFTSDNGPTFNGGSDSPFFDSAAPFKSEQGWGKTSLNEGGIRVPMIAVWKGKIRPNSVTNHVAAGWDVMPTLCEIAKIKSPATDGISFYPALINKKQSAHNFLYWEFPEAGGSKAVRLGNWKGIIKSYIKTKNRTIKLYDLEQDPREQNDVAKDHPEIIQQMISIMQKEHTDPENPEFRME